MCITNIVNSNQSASVMHDVWRLAVVLVIEWIALLRPLDTLRMRLASYGSVGDCAFAPLNNRQLSACRRGACHAGIYHRISRTSQLFLREPGTVWRAFSDVFPWEASPMNLHADMFLPTLQSQCSEQQKDLWLSRAERFEIIGTYAQSELGHGMCPVCKCSSVSAPQSVLLSASQSDLFSCRYASFSALQFVYVFSVIESSQ